MYKKIQPHIAYQSLYPFFFPIKVASDGYRWGYVSFAHFLLYFKKQTTCIVLMSTLCADCSAPSLIVYAINRHFFSRFVMFLQRL